MGAEVRQRLTGELALTTSAFGMVMTRATGAKSSMR